MRGDSEVLSIRHLRKALTVSGKLKNPTMLDFYLIQDDQAKPNNLGKSGLELAGRLDDDTFEELQNEGIIDLRFDCYSTFRWDSLLVNQIQVRLKSINKKTDSVNKLKELLEKASKRQNGLIAYGD